MYDNFASRVIFPEACVKVLKCMIDYFLPRKTYGENRWMLKCLLSYIVVFPQSNTRTKNTPILDSKLNSWGF